MNFLPVVFRMLNKAGLSFIEPRTEDGHGSAESTPSYAKQAGSGRKCTGNSFTGTVGAGETFTGDWVVNEYEHVAVNLTASTDGDVQLQFGIVDEAVEGQPDESDVTITFDQPIPLIADQNYFRALVKMSGRAFRVIYTNETNEDCQLNLVCSYGNNLFPASASEDSELLVTVTEREKNTFFAYGQRDVSVGGYALLVDLSDTTNFLHDRTGRIDLSATYFQVDKGSNTLGRVRVGVVTRIDGTDADIAFVQGVSFDKASETHIERDRNYAPSQLKLGVIAGELQEVITTGKVLGVSAVNTGTALPTPVNGHTAAPDVGDLILEWQHDSGSAYDFFVSGFYHGETFA